MLLGPPGAGKGTQAFKLSQILQSRNCRPAICRAAVSEEAVMGRQVPGSHEEGKLVPEDLAIRLMSDRIARPDDNHEALSLHLTSCAKQARPLIE
ncbi:nucleoside monophosphate kinase [Bradyrhizobium sp. 142]|uniref:nucleoside monophosphate kinase n=1 Tax=Bradyrhizobium sp. 142 TaxID=2782618 RepID=UPI001FF918AE|nr:nucleoside monophosphate kinase [Bradyrhizobium sp. 143]MCK1730743.1 nucleoside monophosphate kinase [Bradyrhizobium sp. 142]